MALVSTFPRVMLFGFGFSVLLLGREGTLRGLSFAKHTHKRQHMSDLAKKIQKLLLASASLSCT